MKLAFFGNEEWQQEYLDKSEMLKAAGVEVVFVEGILTPSHLPEQTDVDAISVFVDSSVDKVVIGALPRLKLIATRSTGYDHIDLDAVEAHGVTVSNVPAYGANTVAEHAFGLLLALSKRIYDGYKQVRETGTFDPHALRGFDLSGKTFGVIGTGRIGQHSARIASGFGMKLVAHDPYPNEAFAREVGATYRPLPELLAESDVVSIHVPYLESTHHLINHETIQHMKEGAVLINTSRGAVVETAALLEALRSGKLYGAGLDVLEEEGIIKDELNFLVAGDPAEHNLKTVLANHVLIDLPNVIVTPHSAFNTQEALERILDTTIENIAAFAKGDPENVVSGEK